MWKMEMWKDMLEELEIFLEEIEPLNCKAFYRKLVALEHLLEYEKIQGDFAQFKEAKPDCVTEYPEIEKLALRNERNIKTAAIKQQKMFTGLSFS